MLLRQMPRESRFVALTCDASLRWGPSEYLLASAVDALHGANWQRGGGKGKRPERLPRPGDKEDDQTVKRRWGTVVSIEELRRRFHPEEFGEAPIPEPAEPSAPDEVLA